jgi:signal transduction histidine kinase
VDEVESVSSIASPSRPLAVGSVAGNATPSRRGRFGLRAKFLILVSVGFIVSGLVFRWVFSTQFERMLRVEFQKRGETLVRGLAASGRLDVWTGNKERLAQLVQSAREEADVVAASVYNVRREVLARSEKIRGAASERPAQVPRSGVAVDSRRLPNGERALGLVAPVELQVEIARAPDDPLALLEGRPRPTRAEVLGAVEIVFSLSEVDQRIEDVQLTTLAITSGIVGVGIVLVLILSRVFIAPIERIAATARRIAEGDRSSRARVSSRDELGELAEAFNTMTTKLSDREDELRRMNVGLEQKVRERTIELELKQQEIMAANVELERASRLKSEFLANMSHELRTPLNAVNGFSELLLEESYGPLNPKQRRYVENILASGKHLLQLINDILDLSKIEAGRMEIHTELFSLRQTIENATSVIQPLAQKKGLTVEVVIEPGIDQVELDPGKTKQVLYNLMSNAVKFTDKGKITISAGSPPGAPGWVEIVVADTGIGIRPQDQPRIFREFEQLDGSHARRYEGTGLGLALTRKLVEIQGGSVRVESEVGRGSRFIARLPLKAQAAGTSKP